MVAFQFNMCFTYALFLSQKLFCRIQESSQVLYKLEQGKSKHEPENGLTKEQPSVSLQQYKVGEKVPDIQSLIEPETITNMHVHIH